MKVKLIIAILMSTVLFTSGIHSIADVKKEYAVVDELIGSLQKTTRSIEVYGVVKGML